MSGFSSYISQELLDQPGQHVLPLGNSAHIRFQTSEHVHPVLLTNMEKTKQNGGKLCKEELMGWGKG